MKPKQIKDKINQINSCSEEKDNHPRKKHILSDDSNDNAGLVHEDINCISSIDDLLAISSLYFTNYFFDKYSDLESVLNGDIEANNYSLFTNINKYYSKSIKSNQMEEIEKPIQFIESLIEDKIKNSSNNKIVLLRGYHGSGKSKFCEGLYLYLASNYKSNGYLPFIFNTDACLEKCSKGKGAWETLKGEFTFLTDFIKKQLANHTCLLILDGVFDPKQLEKDSVMKMIKQEVTELYSYSNFKIIISEDMEDYFLEGIEDERHWMSCDDILVFGGLKYKTKNSIDEYINCYCDLFKISDDKKNLIKEKITTAYPIFKIDSKFIRSLLDSKRNFFDFAQYYYFDVFELDKPENERTLSTLYLSSVVKDIFVDGQIGDSWQTRGTKELLFILNDDYAFYFFIAFIFFDKCSETSDISLLLSDEVFNSILSNKRFRIIDRRIIFFITFMFQQMTSHNIVNFIKKFNSFVDQCFDEWELISVKQQIRKLKVINILIYVLFKCFDSSETLLDNQNINEASHVLLQSIMKFSTSFQDKYLFGIWDKNKEINDDICRFTHCCFYYSICMNLDSSYSLNIANTYFNGISEKIKIYKMIIDTMSDTFISYWGIDSKYGSVYENVFNELLFELENHNSGFHELFNSLDTVLICEASLASTCQQDKKALKSFITLILSKKDKMAISLDGFYERLSNILEKCIND